MLALPLAGRGNPIRRMLAQVVMLTALAAPASAAVILQYHNVATDTPPSTSVTPEQFAGHLKNLEKEGFRVMPLDRLVDAVRGGLDPREKVVAITFDDGAENLYRNALPLLDQRGWKSAIFVTTDLVGGRGMLSADQLRDISRRGHLVLNHSKSHPHMIRNRSGETDEQRAQRLREEISGAQRQLEAWLGEASPKFFAWPFGEFDRVAAHVLKEEDFVGFAQGSGAVDADVSWHAVPRIPVNRHYADWSSLRDKLLALPLPVRRTEPAFGVTTEARPELKLWLRGDWRDRTLNCFAGGKPIKPKVSREEDRTLLRLRARIPEGRGRYTCTASAGGGRFYWYSWMWMRKVGDDWYVE